MKNNILKLKDFNNDTKKITESDFLLSSGTPYTQDHVEINSSHFWNENLKPEWFDVHHFGLDYDKVNLRDNYELNSVSKKGDLQPVRNKQNPMYGAIKSNVTTKGKDIRERPIIVVKDRETNELVYIQDGNTFYRIGYELNFPNFMTLEFYKNSNWTDTNAIALGVYYNLLYKSNAEANHDDIKTALYNISLSSEFKELLKDPDKNGAIISTKLHNYWGMMNGVKKSKTVDITKIINNIIFEKTDKAQKLNPTKDEIFEDARQQGYVNNHLIHYSVYAAWPEKAVTQHWKSERSKLREKSTLLKTIFYMSGSETHNPHWWIKGAYKFISDIEAYQEWFEGSHNIEKCGIAGIYQNHIPTSNKFKLGSIVSVEEIERYYKEIMESDEGGNEIQNLEDLQNLEDFLQ